MQINIILKYQIRWLVRWANYNMSYKEVENVRFCIVLRDAYTIRYSLVYKSITEVYYYLDK